MVPSNAPLLKLYRCPAQRLKYRLAVHYLPSKIKWASDKCSKRIRYWFPSGLCMVSHLSDLLQVMNLRRVTGQSH
jgi:hypothetical protein